MFNLNLLNATSSSSQCEQPFRVSISPPLLLYQSNYRKYQNMKSQCLCFDDKLSTLPRSVIETILCLLPIKEAVRTSILSRDWMHIWTKIPKLDFKDRDFQVSTDDVGALQRNQLELDSRRKFFFAIYKVLLHHQGPIHEFTLLMKADGTCPDLDAVILELSTTNTLKKVSLRFWYYDELYRLPLSIFSLHHLTYLCLERCHLDHQPTFVRFGCLRSLSLRSVNIYTKTLLHLLSNCPLLTDCSLFLYEGNKLGNDNSIITELFECLPLIENLSTSHWIVECFAHDRVTQVLPTKLVHLKHFNLDDMCFTDGYELSFVSLVLRNSPNLEKLMIMMSDYPYPEAVKIDYLEDYSEIWLEHLNEFEIGNFYSSKSELQFVKLILAKSPVLKKMSIWLNDEVTKNEEMMLLRVLLRFFHASPMVEIFVERYSFE